jgi:HAE1 family hydrophobic/amphiphilic exporter-1
MVGGLVFSQAMTLFTTPVIYLYLDRLHYWYVRRRDAGVRKRDPGDAPPADPLGAAPPTRA